MASRLKNMIRLLGWKDGISFYLKSKSGAMGEINAARWATSFRLRPSTTDFDTYEHVFVLKEYDIDLGFQPKLIIDGGANIGMSAIFFSLRYPEAKIISLEPDAKNFELLTYNTRQFSNVLPVRKGIWNESGHLKITNEDADSNAFVVQKVDVPDAGSIPAVSLEDIMKEQQAEIIDIVKLDIEGAEKFVFENNYENWLPKTRLLIIELHDKMQPGSSTALFRALTKYNFSCETKWENLLLFNNDL
jgi:FkbM family methyltransferase